MLYTSVMLRISIRFSVCLVGDYANAFLLLSVVIVTLPHHRRSAIHDI